MTSGLNLCMLISGGGSTASAIIKACQSGGLSGITPVCVIASGEKISGIEAVKQTGINPASVYVVRKKDFANEEEFGEKILEICEKHRVDLIGQYGWLVKTPANVIKTFTRARKSNEAMVEAGKCWIVNQHPGPLDPGHSDFGGEGMYGKRVHAARMFFLREIYKKKLEDFWAKSTNARESLVPWLWTEATAQRVAVNYDEGALLKTARLEIFPEELRDITIEAVDALAKRMLPIEHQLQIDVLKDFANSTVKEFARSERLVKPHELSILENAKLRAKELLQVIKH